MPTPIITETSTNTLATITNGTKIYQQQEITITHISYTINKTNITNTDWITNTINNIPQLDKIETILDKVWYQDPTVWGAIATVVSAIIMAGTFFQIKAQQKKQEEDTQYREDKKELREQIEKYLMPEVEKLKKYGIITSNNVPIQDIKSFNVYSFLCLSHLNNYSPGSFYQDKVIKIFNKIEIYFPIIKYPKEYSNKIIKYTYVLLHNISIDLYKALIDEPTFFKVINRIDSDVNQLEGKLTPEEKIKLKLYKAQNTTK